MNLETLLTVLAPLVIGTACVRFSSIGFQSTRRLATHVKWRWLGLHRLQQAAELVRLNSQLQTTKSGQEWRVMEVAECEDESEDCRSFYLIDPSGQPLPSFLPGQFIMVRPALAGDYQATRCYSLSSAPDTRYWRITVKRQFAEGDDQAVAARSKRPRKGRLSQWLHDEINVGDCLLVHGPGGSFHLPPASEIQCSEPLVLLGAGVGVTPMASMLRWTLQQHPQRPVYLFLQAKDLSHWPLGQVLHDWQASSQNLQAFTYFSRETAEFLAGITNIPGELRAGRFAASDLCQLVGELKTSEYYMCGPDAWMKSMGESLNDIGVEEARIHWESFGPPEQNLTPSSVPTAGLQVEFAHSKQSATWDDPEQSLWELARECDVEIASGCLSGVCGACRVQLLEGDVEYSRSVGVELAENECLSCIARPCSPLKVDA